MLEIYAALAIVFSYMDILMKLSQFLAIHIMFLFRVEETRMFTDRWTPVICMRIPGPFTPPYLTNFNIGSIFSGIIWQFNGFSIN